MSRSDLDDAIQARDLAASQLVSARIQASAAASGADRRAAVAGLEQARGAEQAASGPARADADCSPAAGVVTERDVEPGDVVQPGRALLVVARDGETQLSVLPDEKNLAFLRLGQAALASADAYPDRIFPARVAYIAPAVDPARGTVEVKLDVADPPPFLRPDMTVSVDVEVGRDRRAGAPARAPSATPPPDRGCSPSATGAPCDSPSSWGCGARAWSQVLTGLAPGEAAVLPTAAVGAGARVRTEPAP